ncbi:MAG: hypothetical protein JWQ09_2862 [Segetibacter sp.]|nr:hypothetical protein [Segetibacter sp.]
MVKINLLNLYIPFKIFLIGWFSYFTFLELVFSWEEFLEIILIITPSAVWAFIKRFTQLEENKEYNKPRNVSIASLMSLFLLAQASSVYLKYATPLRFPRIIIFNLCLEVGLCVLLKKVKKIIFED